MSIIFDSGSGRAVGQTPTGSADSGEICIPNISARERRKRLAGGATSLILVLVGLTMLMASGASQWWRLALFPLLWGAALGFFQWRDKT